MTEFVIPMPPSVNKLFRNVKGVGRVKTKEYRSWLTEAGYEILRQRVGRIEGAYKIDIQLARSKRKMDLGNREKAISDLLVKQNIIADDSLAEKISLGWDDELKNGWARIKLEAME